MALHVYICHFPSHTHTQTHIHTYTHTLIRTHSLISPLQQWSVMSDFFTSDGVSSGWVCMSVQADLMSGSDDGITSSVRHFNVRIM